MKKIWMIGLLFALIISGCVNSPAETGQENRRTQPDLQHYHEVADKRREENFDGKQLMNERFSPDDPNTYTDQTITENTKEISESLMESRDIILAEVHETDDRIFVAVKLRENNFDRSHQEDIIPYIEERVQQVIGPNGKQIIVWTDHIQWNEFKNEGARNPMLESINEFFETDD